MKRLKLCIALLALSLLTFVSPTTFAQNTQLTTEEVEEYKAQAEQMVSFLEYLMNTLGKPDATTQQKETIINQSYTKAFVDEDVQIEDDLDEERSVVTNKNVQAYLKDIDFFFEEAEFEFTIDDVSYYVNSSGKVFFRVTANRNLRGITISKDTVNANQLRYIEINLDQQDKALKIASIYTSKLSEREELASWWNDVPYEWQNIFKEKIGVIIDTVNLRMLREIINLKKLDISGNQNIRSVAPLSRLNNLTYLDISGTLVSDIVPLRNLTKLETLMMDETEVSSLEPLKYSTDLKTLVASNTRVSDLDVLANFSKLKKLYLNGTPIYRLTPIKGLKELKCANTAITSLEAISPMVSLEFLDCSSTNVKDLTPLRSLKELESLSLEYTPINNISPLADLPNLKTLRINNTPVRSLEPLAGLKNLERVYCDDTPITKESASEFMMKNRQTLVIYESKQLENWWSDLDNYWKAIFSNYVDTNTLTQETLASIANLTEVDISGKLEITSLEPLRQLQNLKKLNCNNTSITQLEPLTNLVDLQYLDASNTLLTSLRGLENAGDLQTLLIDNTNVSSLLALSGNDDIQYMSCERSDLDEPEILQFIREHPNALVIYKSDELSLWWNEALSPSWKNALRDVMSITGIPSQKQLHEIVFLENLSIEDHTDIWDLSPVSEFVKLRKLELINTSIANLEPIAEMYSLQELTVTRSPIKELEPISKLTSLESLNIEETSIDDLKPIRNFIELETLNFSNTKVKKLKPLSSLINLKTIDCSGTQVKKLKHVRGLYQLETLVVFNTRVSEKEVGAFRRENPGVSVVYY